MLRSAEQRAKRQAELKLANKPSKIEVLPKLPVPGRNANGQFVPGNTIRPLHPGRPRLEFTRLARKEVEERKLLEVVADMAEGKGKFANLDPTIQLKACDTIINRAYGSAATVVQLDVDSETETTLVKRIMGVSFEDL